MRCSHAHHAACFRRIQNYKKRSLGTNFDIRTGLLTSSAVATATHALLLAFSRALLAADTAAAWLTWKRRGFGLTVPDDSFADGTSACTQQSFSASAASLLLQRYTSFAEAFTGLDPCKTGTWQQANFLSCQMSQDRQHYKR